MLIKYGKRDQPPEPEGEPPREPDIIMWLLVVIIGLAALWYMICLALGFGS